MNLPILSSNPVQPKQPSRLDQLMQIAGSGASEAEKRTMLRNLQTQMEGERMATLFAHIPDIKVEEEEEQKEDESNPEETRNRDGDSVTISEEAKKQFEKSQSDYSGSESATPSVTSTAPIDSRTN